jgi:hypothetical protein
MSVSDQLTTYLDDQLTMLLNASLTTPVYFLFTIGRPSPVAVVIAKSEAARQSREPRAETGLLRRNSSPK